MPNVEPRRRSDGTTVYRVRYRTGGRGTPQRSETFTTPTAAQRFADDIDRAGPEGALAILDAREGGDSAMTLTEWCHEHIEMLTGVTGGTRLRYRQIADSGLGAMGALPVASITDKAISVWVNRLEAEGLASKTIANRHGFLYAALERARDKGMIEANPCKGTRLPESRTTDDMVFLTHAELALLMTYIRPDAQDFVAALVGTGHRFGEETALQVRDWDPGNRRISISRAWKYTGVSSKPVLGSPKTKRSRRSHTVAPQVAEIYTRLSEGKAADDFIFTNAKGEPLKAASFHSSVWQPAVNAANGVDYQAKRAGWEPKRGYKAGGKRKPWRTPAIEGARLGKWPRVHDLRHTYASWMLQAGMPIMAVSRRLGHESIKTTVDTYGHLSPAEDAALDAAMEHALGPALPEIEGPSAVVLIAADG